MKLENRRRITNVEDLRTNDPPTSKHQNKLSVMLSSKPLPKVDTSLSRQVDGFFKIPRPSAQEQWDKNQAITEEVYLKTHARGPRQRFKNDNALRRNDSTRSATGGQWIKQTRGPKKD